MDERLKELAEQAGLSREFSVSGLWLSDDEELERFAKQVEVEAVAREREACAQICDDEGRIVPITRNEILNKQCYKLADLIRARGSK